MLVYLFCVIAFFTGLFMLEMTQGLIGAGMPERTVVNIGIFVLTAMVLPFGVALYAFRSRYRLLYGIIELATAIAIVALSVVNVIRTYDSLVFTPPAAPKGSIDAVLQWSPTTAGWFQLAAAIYLFVRGMDNIGEGLSEFPLPNIEARWRRVFPRRKDLRYTWTQWWRRASYKGELHDAEGNLTPIPKVRAISELGTQQSTGPTSEANSTDTIQQ
jgi:hypothetical protein